MKKATTFKIDNFLEFKQKMLNWLKPFNIFCLLENNSYNFGKPAFECLLAVGCKAKLQVHAGDAFGALKAFSALHNDWLFGHLGYDLKNELEQVQSNNFDGIGLSDMCFFVPENVLQLKENILTIFCENNDARQIFSSIQNTALPDIKIDKGCSIKVHTRFTKNEYIQTVQQLRQHILRGDCYEINFCQEFFVKNIEIDPFTTYQKLQALSPNPFAAFYKLEDKFCICASPERYIKKTVNKISSQPIKGTTKRYLDNVQLDEKSKNALLQSDKEKSENIIVVDLVRNDLSKISKEGTVQVDELLGIYSFPQVHQMISSISSEIIDAADWVDVIKATFPMGSMTGAPKKRVMQLIEDFERTKRGLFSGAIGYVNPAHDFDFNVVIRSILYNATTRYLSFEAGSAITFYSDAEKEYEECLLKIAVLKQVLGIAG